MQLKKLNILFAFVVTQNGAFMPLINLCHIIWIFGQNVGQCISKNVNSQKQPKREKMAWG